MEGILVHVLVYEQIYWPRRVLSRSQISRRKFNERPRVSINRSRDNPTGHDVMPMIKVIYEGMTIARPLFHIGSVL
jgi:hypothetical protein